MQRKKTTKSAQLFNRFFGSSFPSVPFVASNVSPNPDRVFKNRTSFNEPVDSSLPLQRENFILHFA